MFYRYADLLGAYVFRLTRSREYTEEIVQDVFLKIWMSREALAEVENFKVYLFVISRNQTLNALRKVIRERNRFKAWEKNMSSLSAVHNEESTYPADETLGIIDEAINQLPEQQKKVELY